MKKFTRFPLVFLLPLLLLSCRSETVELPLPELTLTNEEEMMVNHLNQVAFPLEEQPPLSLEDASLEPLDRIAERVEFLGMGEATHSTREFFEMRHRVFRYLVENHGYKVLAMEADYAESLFIDAYIRGANYDLERIMKDTMFFWIWRTQEVKAMIEWMREYNQGKSPEEQIRYFGMDCQINTLAIEELVRRVRELDPEAADSVDQWVDIYRGVQAPQYEQMPPEERNRIVRNLRKTESFLQGKEGEWASQLSSEEFQILLRLARSLIQSEEVNYGYSQGIFHYREVYMAENTRWLKTLLGENTRVAIWAHNLHVNRSATLTPFGSMGFVLDMQVGDQYGVLGFSFNEGNFRATRDNEGPFDVSLTQVNPPRNSLNFFFRHAEAPVMMVYLSDLEVDSQWKTWLGGSRTMLNIGAAYFGDLNQYYSQSRIAEEYDLLIHFEETQATVPLR